MPLSLYTEAIGPNERYALKPSYWLYSGEKFDEVKPVALRTHFVSLPSLGHFGRSNKFHRRATEGGKQKCVSLLYLMLQLRCLPSVN